MQSKTANLIESAEEFKTGVYRIDIGRWFYIGSSSVCFDVRKTSHLRKLRAGDHSNRIMQSVFDKHADDDFVFTILERCDPEESLSKEQEYLDKYFNLENNMNLSPTASSTRGVKFSSEARAKLSAAHARRVITEHTRKLHSERMKKYRHSEESRLKISESNRKRKLSEETKKKMGEANKGRRMSDENRAKMSARHKGRKKSPETRARMVEANRIRNEKKGMMN